MTISASTIYVVDDDTSVRQGTQDLLASWGFEVVAFGSAAEFFASGDAAASACLILDVNLPGINGFELQQRLEGGRHPPIVFISGNRDDESSVRALKAGAVDFLTKPFTQEDLLTAVRSALRQHREQDGVAVSEQSTVR